MNYFSAHRQHTAFLGGHLESLATLIVSQGESALKEAGIPIQSRTVSTILVIAEKERTSIAEIADTLRQPHQLVTQRVEILLEKELIERNPDPQDGRRKLLTLTPLGQALYKELDAFLEEITKVFVALFDEIGCNLEEKVAQACAHLSQASLIDRLGQRP